MEVLLIGGYGFIGKNLARKFNKEGHRVTIIDKKVEKDEFISYKLDVEDPLCEIVFQAQVFDLVIYLAGDLEDEGERKGFHEMLNLSINYRVKRFLVLTDSTKSKGKNIQSQTGKKQMKFTEIQMGYVYGPMQHISSYENKMGLSFLEKKKKSKDWIKKIDNESIDGKSFHFIDDVVSAVYKSVEEKIDGVIKLSDSNKKLEIKWEAKYTLKEGIKKTQDWYDKFNKENIREKKSEKKNKSNIWKKVLPYIENILLCLFAFYASYITRDSLDRYAIFPVDFHLVYVFVIGIVYGMRQGVLAVVLASISHIALLLHTTPDIVSIVYSEKHMIQLVMFVVVAIFSSYITENYKRKITNLNSDLNEERNKGELIKKAYFNIVDIKNDLQEQVLRTENNLGKMFSYTKELDSLLPEDVLVGSIKVLEQMLRNQSISIYRYSEKEKFLRLLGRSKGLEGKVKNLIDLKTETKVSKAVIDNHIFINMKLEKDLPMMSAAIEVEGQIGAVVFVEQVPIKNLTLYNTNFLRVCVGMIEENIKRAVKYQEAIGDKIYYLETPIVVYEHFKGIIASKEKAKETFGIPFTLVELKPINQLESQETIKALYGIEETIRQTDYIGLTLENNPCILFSNADKEETKIVINRLEKCINNIEFNIKEKL